MQDTETTLYYLQSRYYDPEMGRFINADSLASTGQGVLGSNMFAYCLNNPVTCIDSDGNRTYFINGISNDNPDGPPDYAEDFEEELEECSDEEVKLIPVYEGQTNGLLTAAGAALVLLEMTNQYSYTYKVVLAILADLAENPLAEGETLNIIGYSGGGQLALNAMELLAKQGIHVDNVILIGAPVVEILNTSTKVSMFISSKDILSINWKPGFDAYYVGHLGHTDYFKEAHIEDIAMLVSSILSKGER